jgi:hypothetical protein
MVSDPAKRWACSTLQWRVLDVHNITYYNDGRGLPNLTACAILCIFSRGCAMMTMQRKIIEKR